MHFMLCSHQKVCCGYSCAAISQGHQLKRENASSSQGLLWAGMTAKQHGQLQQVRPDQSLSSWWFARLPTCCPFRNLPSSRSRQTDACPRVTSDFGHQKKQKPCGRVSACCCTAPQPSPTRAPCLQSEQELSEACEV